MQRRHFLGTVAAAVTATTFSALPAFALTTDRARNLVDKLVGAINSVIASGKSQSAMNSEFESIFKRYGDVPTIAAYALGVDGRRASSSQKRAFQTAFSGYIARKYGARFREFIGGRIEVNGVRQVKSYYEVNCTAHLRGERPFALDFMVSDRSGKDLFFNMKIEGVNLLLTERTEIGSMIDRRKGDLDAMIQDLKKAG
ncbi:ABC transporter substrate-binding protein [Marinovum sp. 2_MG-2023]|uniref:MlaC/ttg2D family ABC transporter substrate-binding protein n=1 Tax=unclassified Marinovum TaxID=2647166 RepID=UPI0026E1B96D|nr:MULTISPECIES: ABC transporter substrate-binding protein [unclassified Marinovum]MDO6729687.1 ABC transporter substrate-binding protein [Marinovum sp. 2_MG-2023]MDO6779501.1 ABC transporter substrate-binding protein [Marinovum sp. 1_MG-2023]